MFSKLLVLFAVSVAVVAAAPGGTSNGGINGSCNTGKQYCCNSIQDSKSNDVKKAIGALGLLAGITGNVGLTCNPVDVLAIGGGNKCQTQAACCSGNNFSGLVVVGCSPLNVSV